MSDPAAQDGRKLCKNSNLISACPLPDARVDVCRDPFVKPAPNGGFAECTKPSRRRWNGIRNLPAGVPCVLRCARCHATKPPRNPQPTSLDFPRFGGKIGPT